MPRLLLLRHAKSSWTDTGKADFDRPLNSRGRSAAPAMASFMAEQLLLPRLVVCSTAQRAVETLSLMLPMLASDMDVNLTRRVYESDADGYIGMIRALGGSTSSLMLVGHNPSIEDAASRLAPVGDLEALETMRLKFPTAGLAVIDFDVTDWADIAPGSGRLVAFHTPKSI